MPTNFVSPLSEIDIKKFISLEVTVKEAESLKKLIEERADYIVRKIADITGLVTNWWDFDNEGGEDKRGYFDPVVYHEGIEFVGDFKGNTQYKGVYFDLYDNSFPVEFLWMDFEETVQQEFQKFKDRVDAEEVKKHQTKNEQDKKLKEVIASVRAKVSEEEFSYLSFGTPKKEKNRKK